MSGTSCWMLALSWLGHLFWSTLLSYSTCPFCDFEMHIIIVLTYRIFQLCLLKLETSWRSALTLLPLLLFATSSLILLLSSHYSYPYFCCAQSVGTPKDHQGDQLTKMQKQGLLCAQYKLAGTLSKQLVQQQQEEVPCPSRGHYLKAKPRKVTLAECGVTSSVLIGSCLGTFPKFYFRTSPFACRLTFGWGHSEVICTLQVATLLLLPLAISEDWNSLHKT